MENMSYEEDAKVRHFTWQSGPKRVQIALPYSQKKPRISRRYGANDSRRDYRFVLSTLLPMTPPRIAPATPPITAPLTLSRLVTAPRTAPVAAPIAASRLVCLTTVCCRAG